jgi:L-ascorbate metabolism protein UlaG (beta-lactamase superfamily)
VLLRPAPARGSGLETAGTAVAEAGLAERSLRTTALEPWETVEAGGFRLTAVPAVDGFGDPQVSWVIEAGGKRILHAGDTIFHGSWWLIAMRHGPFDAVFLPVNGAVCDFPHRQPPSPLPASLDPRQAAVAARLLGARLAVPIHYDTLYKPPIYAQVEDPAGSFLREAAAERVDVTVVPTGGALEL